MAPPAIRRRRGFTLPEMAVVLFILAAVTVLVVPRFLSGRIVSNEQRAVEVLTHIVDAQRAFFDRCEGESFAFLSELLGAGVRRKRFEECEPLLQVEEGTWDSGVLTTGGYHFVVYLAGPAKRPMARAEDFEGKGVPRFWVAYAWPERHGTTGHDVYAADWRGRIWSYPNETSPFSGASSAPPASLLAAKIPADEYPFTTPGRMLMQLHWERVATR